MTGLYGPPTAGLSAGILPSGSIVFADISGRLASSANYTINPTTGALTLFDVSGDLVNFSGLSFAARKVELTDGTSAAPITEWGSTVQISRTENLALGSVNSGVVNNGLSNSNAVQNDANAALEVTSINKTTSQMQVAGVLAGARSYSTVSGTDAVGILAYGRAMAGAVGRGTGAYLCGIRDDTGGKALGFEVRVQNNGSGDSTYATSGASDVAGIWITHSSTSVKRAGAGVQIGALSGAGSEFVTGFGVTSAAVSGAAFRDDSSSATSLLINGTHTTGIDLSGATTNVAFAAGPSVPKTSFVDILAPASQTGMTVRGSGGNIAVFRNSSGGSVFFLAEGTATFNNNIGVTNNGTVGEFMTVKYAEELLTLSTSGTTTDTSANLLPANSLILGVSTRVTTTIATATNWSVGDATTATRFSSVNSTLAAGTTQNGINQANGGVAAGAGMMQTAAAKVRITTTGTPSAGVVRVTVAYIQLSAPTS